MTWNWSYITETQLEMREKLRTLPREYITEALLEWYARDGVTPPDLDSLPCDILSDILFERAESFSCSSNGGHMVYLCPDLCHVMLVSPEDDRQNPLS
jgi:hypothetical protein